MSYSDFNRRLSEIEITPEMAKDCALRLIAGAFRRTDNTPRFSIPTRHDDDDVLIIEFIERAARWSEAACRLDQAEGLLREAAMRTFSNTKAARVLRDAWRKSAERARQYATDNPQTNEQWRAFGGYETAMAHADEIDPFCDDRGFDEIVGEGTEATLRAEIRSLREELMCEKLAAKAVLDECTEQISHLREQLERVKRDRDLAFRREDTARKFWIRDAKEALIGKPQALRNRIELCELPPVRAEKCPVDGMPLLVFEDEKREQEEKSRADRLAAIHAAGAGEDKSNG